VDGVYESNTNDFVTGICFEFVGWIQLNKSTSIFRLLLRNFVVPQNARREFLNRYAKWQLLTGDSDLMASGQEHRWTSLPTLIMTKVIFQYMTPCSLQSTVNTQEINALSPSSCEITEKAGR